MFGLRTFATLLIGLLISLPAWGQRHPTFPVPPESAQKARFPHPQKSANADVQKQTHVAEAHKMLVQSDLEKLGQLVNDLKEDLQRNPAGVVSVGALKKTEDIEKLAKRLHKELQEE